MKGPWVEEDGFIVFHSIVANSLKKCLSVGEDGKIIQAVANLIISSKFL